MKLNCSIFGHKFRRPTDEERFGENAYYFRRYNFVCDRDCGTHVDHSDRIWEDTFWKSDEWLYTKIILIVIGLFLLIAFLIIFMESMSVRATCNSYAEMEIPVQWKFWTGCMAEHPKFGWVPVKEYFRILNVNIQ